MTFAQLLQRPLCEAPAPTAVLDAAVVLGAPIGTGPRLAVPLAERLSAGAEIYRRRLARAVCVTGTSAEADAMVARLGQLGVPDSALWVDREAATTRDNAINAAAILETHGCRTAWIVTQSFHLRRACFWFRRCGIDARPWSITDGLPPRVSWVMREYAAWGRVVFDLVAR